MTLLPPGTIDPRSLSQERLPSERFLVPYDLDRLARQEREGPFRFTVDKKRADPSETEVGLIRPLDPAEAYDREMKSEPQLYDICSAYASRIEVLKEQAESGGYSLNRASRAAFFEFLKKNPRIKRGRLVLMENGNLRAVWKGGKEDHVGLQFISTQSIQYVIFTRRTPQSPVSRVSGRDTLDGIHKQVEAFDLNSVLYI